MQWRAERLVRTYVHTVLVLLYVRTMSIVQYSHTSYLPFLTAEEQYREHVMFTRMLKYIANPLKGPPF